MARTAKKQMNGNVAVARPAGELLKIGDAARRLGISPSMIRAWEKMGLITPERTGSAYRLYSPQDLRLLRRAVYLRKVAGLNAKAILNRLRDEGLLAAARNGSHDEQHSSGPRLRNLRKRRGESLSEVAAALGISVGFLSNLERSQSGASVGLARRLAQHYGVNILDLFEQPGAQGPLVRAADRKVLRSGEGVCMELLAWGNIIMEPHLFRVAPGAGSVESYRHDGEEFLFVLKGRLTIYLEGEEFQLKTGDSFYFRSTSPHRWENCGQTEAVILWINTPPSF
ncbi:MAG: cupin domain-containing protein [Acidobacteriaceae bacterium]|nr:cupin domain-containing protein [Acidobacteriaceae bacterium]